MSLRLTLTVVIGVAVLLAALIIVYATPFGSPLPAYTARTAPAELPSYPGIVRKVDALDGAITVTEADDRNLVLLTVGDTIQVDLPPGWLSPTTNSVIIRANGTTFTAIATGNGTITSAQPNPVAPWQLGVDVTPG